LINARLILLLNVIGNVVLAQMALVHNAGKLKFGAKKKGKKGTNAFLNLGISC
jgi:hypothetical protein